MALIVKVYVNDKQIIETHAVRIKGQPGGMCMYRTDDGMILHHHYDDGAEVLASALLKLHKQRYEK